MPQDMNFFELVDTRTGNRIGDYRTAAEVAADVLASVERSGSEALGGIELFHRCGPHLAVKVGLASDLCARSTEDLAAYIAELQMAADLTSKTGSLEPIEQFRQAHSRFLRE